VFLVGISGWFRRRLPPNSGWYTKRPGVVHTPPIATGWHVGRKCVFRHRLRDINYRIDHTPRRVRFRSNNSPLNAWRCRSCGVIREKCGLGHRLPEMSYRIDRTPRPVRFRFGHSLGLPFRRFISAGALMPSIGEPPRRRGVGPQEGPQPWSVGVAWGCLDGAVTVKGAPIVVAPIWPVGRRCRRRSRPANWRHHPVDPVLVVMGVADVML